MPYAFTLTTTIPATAQEIYDAWLDSLLHSEMTGGKASMSDEIDAAVSAWDGYITGRNLELIPGKRIVQSWRTTQFTDEHEDSTITVTLEDNEDGTLLTLVHSNVPEGQTSYEEGGWQEHYFEPMMQYFAARKRAGAIAAAPNRRRKRVAARTKSKPAMQKVRSGAGKRRPKRVIAEKAKSKHARRAKSMSTRGRRRR